MPWLDDLVTLLVPVATLNVDLFTSTKGVPPMVASGAILQLVETSGAGVDWTHTTRVGGIVQVVTTPAYERPSALILARGRTPEAARIKARAAWNEIVGVRNRFINSGWYLSIKPLGGPPGEIPVDDRSQARYSFNVVAVKRPS